MRLFLFAFILSILAHLFIFVDFIKKDEELKQAVKPTQKTNIKYVKLKKPVTIKKEEPKLTKKIEKTKAIKKVQKKIEKPNKKIAKKPVNKKAIKAKKKTNPIPNDFLYKKPKKISKNVNTKKQTKAKNVKNLQQKTLEDFLSQKEPKNKKLLNNLLALYGDEYDSFTSVQKVFLENNLAKFHRITQRVLNRLGYPRLAAKLRLSGVNVVEFMFYPDGSIKNLKITNSSGYEVFDKYTLKLIQIAYKDYPKPKTATKIKYNVIYNAY